MIGDENRCIIYSEVCRHSFAIPFKANQTYRKTKNKGEEVHIGLPINTDRRSPHEREVL